jgi:hypothetical protein
MFDSTTGCAFGPVFDSAVELDDFLEFADLVEPRDLRVVSSHELDALVLQWRGARARTNA